MALARAPDVLIAVPPAVYLALAVASPLLAARDQPGLAGLLEAAFRLFCHQLPERTLHLAGEPMAVCARCAGIAAGLVLGAFAPLRPRLWMLLPATAPMAADGLTQLFGFRESTNTLRVATGLLLGGVAAAWAASVARRARSEA